MAESTKPLLCEAKRLKGLLDPLQSLWSWMGRPRGVRRRIDRTRGEGRQCRGCSLEERKEGNCAGQLSRPTEKDFSQKDKEKSQCAHY
jgi:hypothetical protein